MTPKTIEYHLTKALKALRIALKDYITVFFDYRAYNHNRLSSAKWYDHLPQSGMTIFRKVV
jgi:hypothetical protein